MVVLVFLLALAQSLQYYRCCYLTFIAPRYLCVGGFSFRRSLSEISRTGGGTGLSGGGEGGLSFVITFMSHYIN